MRTLEKQFAKRKAVLQAAAQEATVTAEALRMSHATAVQNLEAAHAAALADAEHKAECERLAGSEREASMKTRHRALSAEVEAAMNAAKEAQTRAQATADKARKERIRNEANATAETEVQARKLRRELLEARNQYKRNTSELRASCDMLQQEVAVQKELIGAREQSLADARTDLADAVERRAAGVEAQRLLSQAVVRAARDAAEKERIELKAGFKADRALAEAQHAKAIARMLERHTKARRQWQATTTLQRCVNKWLARRSAVQIARAVRSVAANAVESMRVSEVAAAVAQSAEREARVLAVIERRDAMKALEAQLRDTHAKQLEEQEEEAMQARAAMHEKIRAERETTEYQRNVEQARRAVRKWFHRRHLRQTGQLWGQMFRKAVQETQVREQKQRSVYEDTVRRTQQEGEAILNHTVMEMHFDHAQQMETARLASEEAASCARQAESAQFDARERIAVVRAETLAKANAERTASAHLHNVLAETNAKHTHARNEMIDAITTAHQEELERKAKAHAATLIGLREQHLEALQMATEAAEAREQATVQAHHTKVAMLMEKVGADSERQAAASQVRQEDAVATAVKLCRSELEQAARSEMVAEKTAHAQLAARLRQEIVEEAQVQVEEATKHQEDIRQSLVDTHERQLQTVHETHANTLAQAEQHAADTVGRRTHELVEEHATALGLQREQLKSFHEAQLEITRKELKQANQALEKSRWLRDTEKQMHKAKADAALMRARRRSASEVLAAQGTYAAKLKAAESELARKFASMQEAHAEALSTASEEVRASWAADTAAREANVHMASEEVAKAHAKELQRLYAEHTNETTALRNAHALGLAWAQE